MGIYRHIVSMLVAATFGACAATAPPLDVPAETARSQSPSVVDPGIPGDTPAARPTISVDDDHALGNRDARVVIVEFADYQCPYCRSFRDGTLSEIRHAYIDPGLVRYVYKDFPLPMHKQAIPASITAHCAGQQGQYWAMQARLYEAQARLSEALYGELARELRLEPERFAECRREAAARRAVALDFSEARRLGFDSTPTFVLGLVENKQITIARIVRGAPAFEEFAREIDALLKR